MTLACSVVIVWARNVLELEGDRRDDLVLTVDHTLDRTSRWRRSRPAGRLLDRLSGRSRGSDQGSSSDQGRRRACRHSRTPGLRYGCGASSRRQLTAQKGRQVGAPDAEHDGPRIGVDGASRGRSSLRRAATVSHSPAPMFSPRLCSSMASISASRISRAVGLIGVVEDRIVSTGGPVLPAPPRPSPSRCRWTPDAGATGRRRCADRSGIGHPGSTSGDLQLHSLEGLLQVDVVACRLRRTRAAYAARRRCRDRSARACGSSTRSVPSSDGHFDVEEHAVAVETEAAGARVLGRAACRRA